MQAGQVRTTIIIPEIGAYVPLSGIQGGKTGLRVKPGVTNDLSFRVWTRNPLKNHNFFEGAIWTTEDTEDTKDMEKRMNDSAPVHMCIALNLEFGI